MVKGKRTTRDGTTRPSGGYRKDLADLPGIGRCALLTHTRTTGSRTDKSVRLPQKTGVGQNYSQGHGDVLVTCRDSRCRLWDAKSQHLCTPKQPLMVDAQIAGEHHECRTGSADGIRIARGRNDVGSQTDDRQGQSTRPTSCGPLFQWFRDNLAAQPASTGKAVPALDQPSGGERAAGRPSLGPGRRQALDELGGIDFGPLLAAASGSRTCGRDRGNAAGCRNIHSHLSDAFGPARPAQTALAPLTNWQGLLLVPRHPEPVRGRAGLARSTTGTRPCTAAGEFPPDLRTAIECDASRWPATHNAIAGHAASHVTPSADSDRTSGAARHGRVPRGRPGQIQRGRELGFRVSRNEERALPSLSMVQRGLRAGPDQAVAEVACGCSRHPAAFPRSRPRRFANRWLSASSGPKSMPPARPAACRRPGPQGLADQPPSPPDG